MRRLVISMILIFCIQFLNAQKKYYAIGLGGNFSYLHDKVTDSNNQTTDLNTSNTFGLNIDFRVDYSFNNYFGISSGLDYIQKNSKNLKRHYISLPLLIKINPIEKLSCDLGGDMERLMYASDNNADMTNFFNKNDYGLVCGINYQILPKFLTSFHYYHSLKDFHTADNSNEHTVMYNRSFVISILYCLNK